MKKKPSENKGSLFAFETLTSEELEKISGGVNMLCYDECIQKARLDNNGQALQECLMECS